MTMVMRGLRADIRLAGVVVIGAFILCHFANHCLGLISLDLAVAGHAILIDPWRSDLGTGLLVVAGLGHYANALWSIHRRRSLRLMRSQRWQLGLGLLIPALALVHLSGTRLGEELLGLKPGYPFVLAVQWVVAPWKGLIQAALVLVLWGHACVGLHLRLRGRVWYKPASPWLLALAAIIPTLTMAGWIAAGSHVARAAAADPEWLRSVLTEARFGPEAGAAVTRILLFGLLAHSILVLIPFVTRHARVWRGGHRPVLRHANGREVKVPPGSSILEALREHGIAHAAACGGNARCTTCRVRILAGGDDLMAPEPLEAAALARIEAGPDIRLACQARPRSDLTILPLLPADALAGEGQLRGGLDGSERPVAVVFVDLRGSTTLGEAKLPYDMLFILNRFFLEMNRAVAATGGHYSNFTGDGLMLLYGLAEKDGGRAVQGALAGAAAMLDAMARLNRDLAPDLLEPLRIGIGIHFGEAIVGSMGPPGSQILSAIGDTVNTTARLEGLTKEHGCALVLSEAAALAAGLDLPDSRARRATVKGRAEPVAFYVLDAVPGV